MTSRLFREGLSRLRSAKPPTQDLSRAVQLQEEGVVPLAGAKLISIDLIRPNPRQVRKDFPQESLEQLAASIRERGLLQPIRVRPDGDGFQLVAGERRWRAARMAGLTEIPAIVSEESDSQAMLDSLIENLQREDLNPVDRAEGLRQLKAALGDVPWAEVGARIGLTERRIFQLLDVARLPELVKADLRAGRLTEKHTRALRGLPSEVQDELRQVIEKERLPAHQVARLVKAMRENPKLDPTSASRLIKGHGGITELVDQCGVLSRKIDGLMDSLRSLSQAERGEVEKALAGLLERVTDALVRIRG